MNKNENIYLLRVVELLIFKIKFKSDHCWKQINIPTNYTQTHIYYISRAVGSKIVAVFQCEWKNYASNRRGWPLIQLKWDRCLRSCQDNVDKFWSEEFWPPNNPYLNPLDFYVWSVVVKVTNKPSHPNVGSLRTGFVDMDSDALKRACERFRPRMEPVIQADRGYIV